MRKQSGRWVAFTVSLRLLSDREGILVQVLLTRSSLLTDKLRAYTKKLIETLTSKSLKLEPLPEDEDSFLDAGGKHLVGDTVFTLNGESFPLICTFDQFLRILENTVR